MDDPLKPDRRKDTSDDEDKQKQRFCVEYNRNTSQWAQER